MLIQIPQHFENSKEILKLPNLSFLYYFNRETTQKVHIELNQHMLIHVFHGSKSIYSDDKEYKITEKQSAFISKGQYFISELLSVETSYFDGIMVFFDDEFLHSIFSKYPVLKESINTKHPKKDALCIVEKSALLHETMLSTQAYLKHKSETSLLIQLKFEEIFLQLIHGNKTDEILKYFQAHYSDSRFKFQDFVESDEFLSVQEMIEKSKLPPSEFRKLFSEIYKSTPKEWLLKKALTKAKFLLKEKELNVTQIAQESGFNSLSWFTKSFKEEFGLTPKKYQQNY